jgi:organic radical activating enzyme
MTQWYCPLPFRHVYIDNQGIAACCQTPRYPGTLDTWKDHPNLINLQQQLLDGQQPQMCHTCVEQEKTQGRSLRTDSNRDYNHEIFADTKIDFIDFRSVNICNFKCRSCFPQFSHGIAQEVNHYPELKKFFPMAPNSKIASVTDHNVDWIKSNLHNLKRVMFTGGEPTVIPGVRELIQEIKQHHNHVMIMLTSNAGFQDDFWFEITEQLPNLHWTVSIDAVNESAEIVRHGSRWSVIENNVRWLATHANSLDINSVVSNLSVFGLRPLLEFGHEMQQLSRTSLGRHGDLGCRHQFFVCQRPYWLTADNWPDDLRPSLIEYLESCLDVPLDPEQKNMVIGLIQTLNISSFDPVLWEHTQSYNQTLNLIRKEDHTTLYRPQL